MIIPDEQYLIILDSIKDFTSKNHVKQNDFIDKIRTVMGESAIDVYWKLKEEKLIDIGEYEKENKPENVSFTNWLEKRAYITAAGLNYLSILKKDKQKKGSNYLISVSTLIVAVLGTLFTILTYSGCGH